MAIWTPAAPGFNLRSLQPQWKKRAAFFPPIVSANVPVLVLIDLYGSLDCCLAVHYGHNSSPRRGLSLIQLSMWENCRPREKLAGGVRRGRIEDSHCIYSESWGRHSVVDLRYQETVWKSGLADLPGFDFQVCHSLARKLPRLSCLITTDTQKGVNSYDGRLLRMLLG